MRRDLRSVRFAAASFGLLGVAAGCVSVLGDFETSNTPAGAVDSGGGSDAPVADTGGNVDSQAPGDGATSDVDQSDAPVDAADLFLNCDAFTQANPLVIDDLSSLPATSQRTFNDRPAMVSIDQDTVRIVTRKPNSSGFTVYTVNTRNQGSPNANGKVDVTTNDNLQQVRHIANGLGILTQGQVPGAVANELHLFTIPDTAAPTAAVPSPLILAQLSVSQTNDFQSNFLELTAGSSYFVDLGYSDPTTGKYALQVGVGGGNPPAKPATIATSTQRYENLTPLHFGSKVHFYSSGDPTQGSAQAYSIADNADINTVTPARDLGSGSVPVLLFDAAKSPGTGYNMAFIEVDTQSTTALATFRVGQLTGPQLDTFKAHDLPQGPVLNDASLLPVDKGDTRWFGDDFVAIGKGSPATNTGFNLVWLDAQGRTRGMRVGKDAILADRAAPKTSVAVSPSQKVGIRYQTWNVVWSETHTDANNQSYDILYLNELACH